MALETIGSGRWWPRALRRLSLVADLEAESAPVGILRLLEQEWGKTGQWPDFVACAGPI